MNVVMLGMADGDLRNSLAGGRRVEIPGGHGRKAGLLATGDREFICDECGRRCTRGNSGTEYGHRRWSKGRGQPDACSQRPTESVDPDTGTDRPGLQSDSDGENE